MIFSREGFGRQSMSEKRKGHLDPKSTELYQKIKLNKAHGNQYLSGMKTCMIHNKSVAFWEHY